MGARLNKPVVAGILLIALLAVGAGVWYFFLRHARPDFDQLGGTILVYTMAEPADADSMAKALQVRVDPDDRGDAGVKHLAKNLIEIRIPRTSDKHADEVARIKELVLAVGHLEFMMLANSQDDAKAIEQARMMLNTDDPDMKKQLKELQEKGLPPPVPRDPATKEPMIFSIDLAKGEKSQVTYRWVELGPQERRSLNLNKEDPNGSLAWQDAKKNLGKAAVWNDVPNSPDRKVMNGALFYSRECANQNLPEKERWKKAVDYFVLAREPEIDPSKPVAAPLEQRRAHALDGSLLTSASAASERDQLWFVNVTFNAEGRELLRVLTRKNVSVRSEAEGMTNARYLAIVWDGQVISAPTINSEIPGGQAQISGAFGENHARNMSAILRAGALPGGLKWFSEREATGWMKQEK